jgi:hypothetical protein
VNSAVEVGTEFLFTRTPTPVLRNRAAAVSSATTDTGRIVIMKMQMKIRQFEFDNNARPNFPHEFQALA